MESVLLTQQAISRENSSIVLMGGERIATQVGGYYNRFGGFEENDDGMAGTSLSSTYGARYQQLWLAQQLAYRHRYDSLGVHFNATEPPISKSAGYVQQTQLPDLSDGNAVSSSPVEDYVTEGNIEELTSSEEITSDSTQSDEADTEVAAHDDDVTDGYNNDISAITSQPLRQLLAVYAKGLPISYYYHKDHLGSSTLITNSANTSIQQIDYSPYGEIFLEHKSSNWDTPYKFTGKELDEETGLYYYGARYYDPRLSIWHGTDPMQEKYPGVSTYCYTMGNPINLIDDDGNDIIPYFFRHTNNSGYGVGIPYRSSRNFVQAMNLIGKTAYGQMFIGSFIDKNHSMYGVKGNGRYSNYRLEIRQFDMADANDHLMMMMNKDGSFGFEENDHQLTFILRLDVKNKSVNELAETILHEISVHGSKFEKLIEAYENGGIDAVNSLMDTMQEHSDLKNENIKTLGVKKYVQTRDELLKMKPDIKKVFEKSKEDYQRVY